MAGGGLDGGGAGEGVLPDTCLGSCLGGVDRGLMIGDLDLLSLAVLVGRPEECLAEARLSLGRVVVLKVGMGIRVG